MVYLCIQQSTRTWRVCCSASGPTTSPSAAGASACSSSPRSSPPTRLTLNAMPSLQTFRLALKNSSAEAEEVKCTILLTVYVWMGPSMPLALYNGTTTDNSRAPEISNIIANDQCPTSCPSRCGKSAINIHLQIILYRLAEIEERC